FRLLDQYLERLERLDGTLRRRFTADLAARFAPRFPWRDADPEAFLVRLHTAEFEKRSGRLAARPTEGVGRTTVVAERFVTRKRDSWEAFRTLAARAERIGLKQLGAAAIPGFAARYREVAADLARARAGAEHRAQGVGYAQQPSMYLPVIATGIITNNVQVAFLGFAFGITAGIGTVLLLVFNGLHFGAVLGLFANYGLAGWLLT